MSCLDRGPNSEVQCSCLVFPFLPTKSCPNTSPVFHLTRSECFDRESFSLGMSSESSWLPFQAVVFRARSGQDGWPQIRSCRSGEGLNVLPSDQIRAVLERVVPANL